MSRALTARIRTLLFVFPMILVVSGVVVAMAEKTASTTSDFTKSSFDLGVYVSNIDASAKFYSEAIGLTESPGFKVTAEFCADSGLTAGKEITIRQFSLSKEPGSQVLKLIAPIGDKAEKSGTPFISSQYGYRYITIHVTDMNAAMARLAKAGVKAVGKSPVQLPKSLDDKLYLTLVHDPDGNMIELIGPKL